MIVIELCWLWFNDDDCDQMMMIVIKWWWLWFNDDDCDQMMTIVIQWWWLWSNYDDCDSMLMIVIKWRWLWCWGEWDVVSLTDRNIGNLSHTTNQGDDDDDDDGDGDDDDDDGGDGDDDGDDFLHTTRVMTTRLVPDNTSGDVFMYGLWWVELSCRSCVELRVACLLHWVESDHTECFLKIQKS